MGLSFDDEPSGPVDLVIRSLRDAKPSPWRNGGGVTRELAREPSHGDFDWRISVAEVASDGPFSIFNGYDRAITLLSGNGMDLRFTDDGSTVRLRAPWGSHEFAGERPIVSTLVDGPTTDFNLMWRRGAVSASFMVVKITARDWLGGHSGTNALFIADGSVRLNDGTALTAGDLAIFGGSVRCDGSATILCCWMDRT